jgi:hypothetical protein
MLKEYSFLYIRRLFDFVGHEAINVKVKFTLEQATKAQMGSRCIALLFLQPQR